MLNKLQAIIKNVIIAVYCLARSSVGVRMLRAGQALLRQRVEDPQRGSALSSGLVTPPGGGGGSGGSRDASEEGRRPWGGVAVRHLGGLVPLWCMTSPGSDFLF